MYSPPNPLFSSGHWRHCVCCRYWVYPTSGMCAQTFSCCYSEPNKKHTPSQKEHSSSSLSFHKCQPPAAVRRATTCGSSTHRHSRRVELGFINNQMGLFAPDYSLQVTRRPPFFKGVIHTSLNGIAQTCPNAVLDFAGALSKNSEASGVFQIRGQPSPKNVSKGTGPHDRSLLLMSPWAC